MEEKESVFLMKWRNSSTGVMLAVSILLSMVTTLVGMTISFLVMLFSSGEDGMRYCFFQTIFFKSATDSAGVTSMSFGLTGEWFPIVFFAGICFAMLFGTYYFAKKLLQYRHYLVENQKSL